MISTTFLGATAALGVRPQTASAEAPEPDSVIEDLSVTEHGKYSVTGFGLSIVKQIVEAQGWDVGMTRSDRGGARFEMCGTSLSDQQDD